MVPFIFIYNQFSAAALIGVSIHFNYSPSSLALNDSQTFTTTFQPPLKYASVQGSGKHPTASVLQTSPHLRSFMNSSKSPWFIQKTTYIAALPTTVHLAQGQHVPLLGAYMYPDTHSTKDTVTPKMTDTDQGKQQKKRLSTMEEVTNFGHKLCQTLDTTLNTMVSPLILHWLKAGKMQSRKCSFLVLNSFVHLLVQFLEKEEWKIQSH